MLNLLWFSISVVIVVPFLLAVNKAKESVEEIYGRKPHGHFHDIPNGLKILPTWAGVFLVFMVVDWQWGVVFFAVSFLINWLASELSYMVSTPRYRERYLKLYLENTATYWIACLICYAVI